MPAEVVLVLPGIEEVFRQLCFTGYEEKCFGLCDGGPESCATANRAVTAVRVLREIEFGLGLDGTAVAATVVGLEQGRGSWVEGWGVVRPGF